VAHPTPTYLFDAAIGAISIHPDGSRVIVNDTVWDVTRPCGRLLLHRSPLTPPSGEFISLAWAGDDQLWATVPDMQRPADEVKIESLRQLAPRRRTVSLPREGYADPDLDPDKYISVARARAVALNPAGNRALLSVALEGHSREDEINYAVR